MTKRSRFPRLGQSIFAKLLAIMMVTALTLLVLVTGFFAIVVFPTTTLVTQSVVREYARMLAATSPDLVTAQGLQKRIYVKMRYEGPRGSWTTDESLPTIAQARQGGVYATSGIHYHVEPAPDGGAYLLSWNVSELTRSAHIKLLWLLSFLMLGVVFTAYYFQKKLLQPLRSLSDGVVRVGANDLNVVLPVNTRDEFGALTESFNNMVRRVREMIEARDQLLLDVSHELRSPITRMKVALALSSDEEMKSGMTCDLNEMEAMITELLELERLRDGKGIRREYQDIVSILRELVRSYENRAPGIRFSTSPASLLLDVDGDKIRTVFRNLLENGVKYSLADSRPIEVSVEQDNHSVRVRFADDGIGIPESDLHNIFEPFFRVDRSRSKKTGGFGLGLSICKRVMTAHGGTISAEDKPGRGASFVLTFPTARAD